MRLALEEAFPDMMTVYRRDLPRPPDGDFVEPIVKSVKDRDPLPRILYGHFSFGVHNILGVVPRYATFLRHPVDRIVSLFRHQAAHPVFSRQHGVARGLTLREFVSSTATEQNNNHICRLMAGVSAQPGQRICDDAIVDAAFGNIRRYFVFVGFVDRFDDSMRALGEILETDLQTRIRVNVSTYPAPQLDEDDRAAIIRENALDLKLYERVRELLLRTVTKETSGVHE